MAPAIQVGSFSHSAIESSGPLANYITQLTTANEQLKLEPWAGEGPACCKGPPKNGEEEGTIRVLLRQVCGAHQIFVDELGGLATFTNGPYNE